MCLCWVFNIFFLPYRTTHPRIYLRKKNLNTWKLLNFIWLITTNNRLETSIIWSICLYGCSCLVVWYYVFIWLLVLFGRCCTFFHLQGAFLRGWITFKNPPCGIEEERAGFWSLFLEIDPTPPYLWSEKGAFHLLSCVCSPVWSFYVVLLKCVELKCIAFYLPCARFILFVICGAACLLIMRYRAF